MPTYVDESYTGNNLTNARDVLDWAEQGKGAVHTIVIYTASSGTLQHVSCVLYCTSVCVASFVKYSL